MYCVQGEVNPFSFYKVKLQWGGGGGEGGGFGNQEAVYLVCSFEILTSSIYIYIFITI